MRNVSDMVPNCSEYLGVSHTAICVASKMVGDVAVSDLKFRRIGVIPS